MLTRQWEDSLLHMQHYRYRQTYKGLRVEAAEYTEHATNGYFIFSNGKLVPDLNADPVPAVSEVEALSLLLGTFEEHTFAWESDAWELQIQSDTGDSTATLYPLGELLWAIDDYRDLIYSIPAERYKLAWRFEILCLEPRFHKAFYVDARTGEVFREERLSRDNGPADIWHHGTRTIDSEWGGPWINKHILKANDNDRIIHTKYSDPSKAWNNLDEATDGNDVWDDVADKNAATAHWMTCESWDYFNDIHHRNGPDDNREQVRVVAEWEVEDATNGLIANVQYLSYGIHHGRAIDVVGHEYTHAVTRRVASLVSLNEPGALDESFSDIFGFLIERRTEGAVTAWTHGEDPGNIGTRSFDDPNSAGAHPVAGCSLVVGQPDTYSGTFWYTGTCDDQGIHANSSVQNHWFYLLAEGGAGTNDNNDSYIVQGIGIDNAAKITYWNLENVMMSGSQYADARLGAIMAAQLIFGVCSNEEAQCRDAWHAVGLGPQSPCYPTAILPSNQSLDIPQVFPNPSEGQYFLKFRERENRSVDVVNPFGQLVFQTTVRYQDNLELDLRNAPDGVYFLNIHAKTRGYTLKLIKQSLR